MEVLLDVEKNVQQSAWGRKQKLSQSIVSSQDCHDFALPFRACIVREIESCIIQPNGEFNTQCDIVSKDYP